MNFSRSMIDNSQELAIIKGNFETLGSKFSHETAGLLASLATTDTILRTPISQHKRAMILSVVAQATKVKYWL